MIKRILSILFPVGLIFSLLLPGCSLLPREDEVLQPPLRAPNRVEYSTAEVTRGTIINEIQGMGVVEAKETTMVSFQNTSGRIKAFYAVVGADIQEGDLLAELHNDELIETLERRELYYRLAEIEYENLRRNHSLTRLDREAAQIRLRLSEMDLEKARLNVENTQIFAPVSGRIIYSTSLRNDEYIESFIAVFGIVDLSQLILRVSGDFATRVPVGAEVSVFYEGERHIGIAVQSPTLTPQSATDSNHLIIDTPTLETEQWRLGNRIAIIYELERAEDVIVIESSLIRTRPGRSYVLVLIDDVPVERNVVIGIANNAYSEIVEGLYEGELVIR